MLYCDFFHKCWFGDTLCSEQSHPPCGCLLTRCLPHSDAILVAVGSFLCVSGVCCVWPLGRTWGALVPLDMLVQQREGWCHTLSEAHRVFCAEKHQGREERERQNRA